MADEASTAPAESAPPEDESTPETEEEVEGGEGSVTAEPGEGEAEPVEKAKPEVFDIDGEEVTMDDLKEGYRKIRHAVQMAKDAKELRAQTKEVLGEIVEHTDDALMKILTAANGGDRQKGYAATIKWAAKIVNDHVKVQGLSDAEREALRHKTEAEEYKRRYESAEAEKKQAKRAENKKVWESQLTEAAKKVGLPTDPDTMEDIARALVNGNAAGFKLDPMKAAEAIKKEYAKRRTRLWSGTDLDEVPPDVLERLRKRDLETVKKSRGAPPTKTPKKAESGETFWAPSRAQSF